MNVPPINLHNVHLLSPADERALQCDQHRRDADNRAGKAQNKTRKRLVKKLTPFVWLEDENLDVAIFAERVAERLLNWAKEERARRVAVCLRDSTSSGTSALTNSGPFGGLSFCAVYQERKHPTIGSVDATMLHSGASAVSYDHLRAVQTPAGTDSHVPVPHHEIVELLRYTLGFYGHEIGRRTTRSCRTDALLRPHDAPLRATATTATLPGCATAMTSPFRSASRSAPRCSCATTSP